MAGAKEMGSAEEFLSLNHRLIGVVGKYLSTFAPQVGFFQGMHSISGVPQWDSVKFP